MKGHTMNALLWREWRWNRRIVATGVMIFFLPYVIALVIMLWQWEELHGFSDVNEGLKTTAFGSYVLSQLTLTLLSGNAIAGERSDRTAEFLAYLPVSKRQRVAAKFVLIAFIASLVWGINWLIIVSLGPWDVLFTREILRPMMYLTLYSFAAFGAAWFVSSMQSSPTYAVAAGIATPILLLNTVFMIDSNFSSDVSARFIEVGLPMVCLTLGTAGIATGTWSFLKRVEP